jgi:two-component system chemotaxis response regulator CheY
MPDLAMAFGLHRTLATMRVLIVDDYPGLIELYDLGLAARGFEVVGAATASEALMLAAHQKFDAVVIDYELPDVPGVDLLRRLRALPQLEGRPIVGISSYSPSEVPADTYDAFLQKPLHPKKLAAALRRLLVDPRDKQPLSA